MSCDPAMWGKLWWGVVRGAVWGKLLGGLLTSCGGEAVGRNCGGTVEGNYGGGLWGVGC